MSTTPNNQTPSTPPLDEPSCSVSVEVRRMVFAFDDHGRQCEVRRLADRVMAIEHALVAARNHILERNGLCRDADREAAMKINRVLNTPNPLAQRPAASKE